MNVMDWKDMAGSLLQQTETPLNPISASKCPFCDRKEGFEAEKLFERPAGDSRMFFVYSLKCRNCGNYNVIFQETVYVTSNIYSHLYVQYPHRPEEDKPHDSFPLQVAAYITQAKRSLRTQSWDAAAIMARSVLQSVMRDFGAQGGGLAAEINDLQKRGIIVTALKDWADHVRLVANEVVHPDPESPTTSEDDARDLVRFTEYFLHYVYVIPWEIANQKARKNKA